MGRMREGEKQMITPSLCFTSSVLLWPPKFEIYIRHVSGEVKDAIGSMRIKPGQQSGLVMEAWEDWHIGGILNHCY